MPTIELSAFDTLFVRDGKPFSMGEDVWASGIFPPPPSVIYGALRTAYFGEHPEALATWLASKNDENKIDPTSFLRIQGIYVCDENKPFFSFPHDVVADNKEKSQFLQLNAASENTSCHTKYVLTYPENVENLGGTGFMSRAALGEYLSKTSAPKLRPNSEFWMAEPKLGIEKSAETGSSAIGKFYRAGMNRPLHNMKFQIVYNFAEATDIATDGFLKLGGEGKATSYITKQETITVPCPVFQADEKRFKLYLATPSLFELGWLPAGTDSSLQVIWREHHLKILTAAINRPMLIGGFDMAENKPKRMQRAVPAGSVYYVEYLGSEDINQVVAAFHHQCLSESNTAKEGFGLTFVGKV